MQKQYDWGSRVTSFAIKDIKITELGGLVVNWKLRANASAIRHDSPSICVRRKHGKNSFTPQPGKLRKKTVGFSGARNSPATTEGVVESV
jgi:hypothetical protein